MEISGITQDGNRVVSGVFRYLESDGLPLEVVLENLKKSSLVVDWEDFISSALKNGMSERSIRARIVSAIGDVYGPEYRRIFEERLA